MVLVLSEMELLLPLEGEPTGRFFLSSAGFQHSVRPLSQVLYLNYLLLSVYICGCGGVGKVENQPPSFSETTKSLGLSGFEDVWGLYYEMPSSFVTNILFGAILFLLTMALARDSQDVSYL